MEAAHRDEVIRAGDLEIHPGASMAVVDGCPLALSVREIGLLVALADRQGRIVSRDELHTVVWGGSWRKSDRSVDVYVSKLRTKLEEALPDWRFIHTHFGFGYRFGPEPAGGSHGFHKPDTRRQQTGRAPLGLSPAPANRDKEHE